MKNKNKIIQIVLIIVFSLISIFFIINSISRYWDGIRVDFPSFYYAADLAINGLSPYRNGIWESVKSINLPNQDLYPFLNIPFSLVLFFPLRLAEFQVSQTIFLIINIAATFVLIYLLSVKILRRPILDPFVLIGGGLLLLFPPVRETISHGQVNLIVIVLICISWLAVKENKSALVIGLPLALAILLKVYPGIFILYLLEKKKYKSIAVTVAIIALFALTAYVLLPTSVWEDWYLMVGRIKYGGVYARKIPSWKVGNQSLNGFITRFFLGARNRDIVSISDYIYQLKWWQKRTASLILGYLSAGFLALAWLILGFRKWKQGLNGNNADLDVALLLFTMFLVAPISWDHHLVFVIPSIVVLMDHFIRSKSFGPLFWISILLSGLLFYNFDLSHPFFQRGALGILVSAQFFAVFGLWILNLIIAYQSSNRQIRGLESYEEKT